MKRANTAVISSTGMRAASAPSAAIEKLKSIQPPRDNRALRIRHGLLTADALEAAGQREGAAAIVQALVTEYPDVPRLKQRLDSLK